MKQGMPDRFSAGTSMIHKMDAGVKLICYLLLLISVLAGCHLAGYAATAAFAAAALYLAQISLATVLRVIYRMRWLMILTLVLNFLFFSSDRMFISIIVPSINGLIHGLAMVLRIALILVFSLVFSATTSPVKMARALDALLRPLTRIMPSAAGFSTVFTLAMRFIPVLFQDAEEIRQLQTVRGVSFGKSNYLNQPERIKPVFIPLALKAFRRADTLAMAMEARGYDCCRGCTAAPWSRPKFSEGMAILVCAALCALQIIVI